MCPNSLQKVSELGTSRSYDAKRSNVKLMTKITRDWSDRDAL